MNLLLPLSICLLLAECALWAFPALPRLIVTPPRFTTNYFAVTATNSAGGSDYSNEATFINSNRQPTVALAWDRSPDPTVTGYRMYWGRSSRTYTNSMPVGNTNYATVQLFLPPKTNLVISISTTGTNLQCANKLAGPWYFLNRTTMMVTNPALWPVFYRGAGAGSNRVSLTTLRY